MTTVPDIGVKQHLADTRTVGVLMEHAPEAAQALSMITGATPDGRPVPVGFHLPEHAAFVSEAMAALAELVADQAATISDLEGRIADLEAAV